MTHFKIAFSTMQLEGKIPHGSPLWNEFNASFENDELPLPAITYMIDDGCSFTTWHDHQWRKSANFLCGQHIGIDFDERSVDDALLDPFVQRYAGLVYRTPSSTAESPRCRVLFALDVPIYQSANYVAAVTALIWLFGATADRKCKDACRFFYGSLGSMPTRLNNVLPLETVKALIASHRSVEKPRQTRHKFFRPSSNDAIEAARLLERLAPARADDYEDWVTVGMALQGLGNEGLSLWEAWSARSAKHIPGECERKWGSFRGEGVGMGSLVHMAKTDSLR